jgi:hypothetical protein
VQEDQGVTISILFTYNSYFSSAYRPDGLRECPSLLQNGYPGLFPGRHFIAHKNKRLISLDIFEEL